VFCHFRISRELPSDLMRLRAYVPQPPCFKEFAMMIRNLRRNAALLACCFLAQWSAPLLAFEAGFLNAAGETVFSPEFMRDYQSAEAEVHAKQSAEPFVQLLAKSKRADEKAELEVTLGVIYVQRTELVNPTKAVEHFTKALGYRLSDETVM